MSITSRKYLRAPVHRWALYSDDDVLLRGKVIDISHGGVLLGELSLLPKNKEFLIFFELPLYDDFSKINWQQGLLGSYQVKTQILSTPIKIVRHYQKGDDVSALFENIGATWINPSEAFLAIVDNYIDGYRTNLRFLLSLFESSNKNKNNDQLIIFLTSLLGIEIGPSLAHLRTKLMHRFQSVSQL